MLKRLIVLLIFFNGPTILFNLFSHNLGTFKRILFYWCGFHHTFVSSPTSKQENLGAVCFWKIFLIFISNFLKVENIKKMNLEPPNMVDTSQH